MQEKQELNEDQKKVAGLIMLSMRTKYNNDKLKIKSKEMILKITDRGYKIGDAELRKIIGFIRRNDMCSPGFILADNAGYWYSEETEDLKRVWESEYGRALAILKNFSPLRRRFKHLISEEQGTIFNAIENSN